MAVDRPLLPMVARVEEKGPGRFAVTMQSTVRVRTVVTADMNIHVEMEARVETARGYVRYFGGCSFVNDIVSGLCESPTVRDI